MLYVIVCPECESCLDVEKVVENCDCCYVCGADVSSLQIPITKVEENYEKAVAG